MLRGGGIWVRAEGVGQQPVPRSWGRIRLWAFEDLKEGPYGLNPVSKDEGGAEGDKAGNCHGGLGGRAC